MRVNSCAPKHTFRAWLLIKTEHWIVLPWKKYQQEVLSNDVSKNCYFGTVNKHTCFRHQHMTFDKYQNIKNQRSSVKTTQHLISCPVWKSISFHGQICGTNSPACGPNNSEQTEIENPRKTQILLIHSDKGSLCSAFYWSNGKSCSGDFGRGSRYKRHASILTFYWIIGSIE